MAHYCRHHWKASIWTRSCSSERSCSSDTGEFHHGGVSIIYPSPSLIERSSLSISLGNGNSVSVKKIQKKKEKKEKNQGQIDLEDASSKVFTAWAAFHLWPHSKTHHYNWSVSDKSPSVLETSCSRDCSWVRIYGSVACGVFTLLAGRNIWRRASLTKYGMLLIQHYEGPWRTTSTFRGDTTAVNLTVATN